MSRSLNLLHHKLVFGSVWLNRPFLSGSVIYGGSLNGAQINFNMSVNILRILCRDAALSPLCESDHFRIPVTTTGKLYFLLNCKANSRTRNATVFIIDNSVGFNNFMRFINIFFKLPHHSRYPLVHATPGGNFAFIHLVYGNCKICRRLSYNKDLLVLNFLISCLGRDKLYFNMILNKSHRFASHVRTVKEHR
jgi:hypothetical protein